MVQAENALIELGTPLFGIGTEHLWNSDTRKKYLDCLIGAGLKADKETV